MLLSEEQGMQVRFLSSPLLSKIAKSGISDNGSTLDCHSRSVEFDSPIPHLKERQWNEKSKKTVDKKDNDLTKQR